MTILLINNSVPLPPFLHIARGIRLLFLVITTHRTGKHPFRLLPSGSAFAALVTDILSDHLYNLDRLLLTLLHQPLSDISSLPLGQGVINLLIRPSRLWFRKLHNIDSSRLLFPKKLIQPLVDITMKLFLQPPFFRMIFLAAWITSSIPVCSRIHSEYSN